MTPSERTNAVLDGKTPDQLCWLPELNDRFIKKVVDTKGPVPEGMDEQTFVNQVIGADQLHRATAVKTIRPNVEVIETTTDGTMVTRYITPKGELVLRQEPNEIARTRYTHQHILAGPETFDAYKALWEDTHFEPDYDRAKATHDQIGDTGMATIDVPNTPLMHMIMWDMGIEPTLMAVFDYPEQMREIMDVMHERNKEYYRIACAGPGRVVRPMEDTSSKLSSPSMYREWSIDYLIDYANICHEHGKTFIVHMCGHLYDMVDVIKEVPLDGIEAITPPPTGDADLRQMRDKLGDIVLWGGIDPTTYATLKPDEMRQSIATLLEQMKGDRRFILGHEEIPSTANLENVRIVAELVAATADGYYD